MLEIIHEIPVEIIREVPAKEDLPPQEESFVIDEIDTMGWHQVSPFLDTTI